MSKRKTLSVKKLTRTPERVKMSFAAREVKDITHEGVSEVGKMSSNLVSAAGFGKSLNKSETLIEFFDLSASEA